MVIHRDPLPQDNYTLISNDWLRDPRTSYKGKGILAAIASHRSDYPLTVEQLIAQSKDGRDAVYAGLQELVAVGYLVVERTRDERGRMKETDFRLVSPPPLPDLSKPGFSRSGKPRRGKPTSGKSDTKKTTTPNGVVKEDQGLPEEDQPSPLPPEINSPPPPAEPKGEGARFDHQTQRQLTEATDAVLELKPGWKRSAVAAAMLAEIDAGRTPAVVARAVVNMARLADSNSPGRLKHDGPWWNLTEQAPTPVRDLPPDAPRCRRHRGQPAHACAACLGEQRGVDRPEPEPEPDPAAREHARELVRTLTRQRRRARTGVPTAVGDLLSTGGVS